MDSFLIILEKIATLMVIIAIGFAAEKTGYVKGIKDKVSHIILRITLPLLVITSITSHQLDGQMLRQAGFVTLVAFVIILLLYVLALLVAKIFRLTGPAKSMHTLCSMFGNVAFLGYPLIRAVCGEEAVVYAVFFVFANDILLYSLGIMLATGQKRPQFKRLINPNTISLVIGVIMAVFGLRLPDFWHGTFTTVGDATVPLSMLFIGATLAGTSLRRVAGRPTVYVMVLVKMVLVPMALIFLLQFVDFIDLSAKMVIILQTSMSCATVTAIFAKEYDSDLEYASSAIFIMTLCSLITVPIIYSLAQRVLG